MARKRHRPAATMQSRNYSALRKSGYPFDKVGVDCLSRQWVIWHVIEHDLHYGGELSFSPGMHGLAAPDL